MNGLPDVQVTAWTKVLDTVVTELWQIGWHDVQTTNMA